jgi:hypothetical protein
MSNEADSRHTTPFPRWGETAAQVPSVNVVEPSGGKKDLGWVPGAEGVVGEWWNWLHWAAGVFFRYVENALGLGLIYNHVMAGAAGTEGVVTAGAGLSVNVSSSRCWIGGGMYKVPAATNLALAAADPTHARLDLVYSKVTAGAPLYAVVTGTPSATLPLPVPAVPAGGTAIATVQVNAAAVVPGAVTSLREFGGLQLDRIIARRRIDVGDITGTPSVTLSDASGLGNGITVGDPADPTFQANADLDIIVLHPEAVSFTAAIVRRFDIDALDFRVTSGTGGAETVTFLADGSLVLGSGGTQDYARAPARVPNAGTITVVRVRGSKVAAADGLTVQLFKRDKATGTVTDLTAGGANNEGVAGSPFVLAKSLPVPEVVDQSATYFVQLKGGASGGATIFSATVEWEETRPFDGL